MLTELDPSSHWLAGEVAGIHLFTLAGGMAIGAAAVLLYHAIGRIAGVSGIFFAGFKEGGLWRWLFPRRHRAGRRAGRAVCSPR